MGMGNRILNDLEQLLYKLEDGMKNVSGDINNNGPNDSVLYAYDMLKYTRKEIEKIIQYYYE